MFDLNNVNVCTAIKKRRYSPWKFPRFGESPGSTPDATPRSLSPEAKLIKEEEEKAASIVSATKVINLHV